MQCANLVQTFNGNCKRVETNKIAIIRFCFAYLVCMIMYNCTRFSDLWQHRDVQQGLVFSVAKNLHIQVSFHPFSLIFSAFNLNSLIVSLMLLSTSVTVWLHRISRFLCAANSNSFKTQQPVEHLHF